ncbi:hypothetical protein CMQ_1632 [Grosmannia clavigera kw1407]|uniref:Uncharacterized protein n=1 Tax=Grosmannia clavigera (strain kw1407 / UAMH 11150) TaxID=655863 RepID=F0XEN0_GROCL|nr:uncharacterized protein CMQ_1632 [Grosmannia clavigera kw1407]EFX04704.1 hypothetical protein CMQ_1632 [Grosmannia clavigera kw1407]
MSSQQPQESVVFGNGCGHPIGKYKPHLDQAARDAEEHNRAMVAKTETSTVSRLIDQASSIIPESIKKTLGTTDNSVGEATEPQPSSDQSIKDTHVEEFVRDQHRSKPSGARDD